MSDHTPTVGILYPGEMGASLAAVLRARGARVVTTLAGRGEQTARRASATGVEVLESLADVVRASEVLICLVPPASAEQAADDYCELAHLSPPGALYVDANSIGPELSAALASRVARHGRGFVDAAINGLSKNLTTSGTLFLSGPRAGEVARLFGDSVAVKLLGDQPGRASAMKMLLSGLSKGVCALFVETALTAHRHGMLAEMAESYTRIYPGIMALVDRMLPTYAGHAARRVDETRELEQTAQAAGFEPCVLAAVRQLHELLAGVDFSSAGQQTWTTKSLIEKLAAEGFLTGDLAAGPAAWNAPRATDTIKNSRSPQD
ncbi:MAG: putative dehydrogenase [Phycisphaerales bacterium]|nr:putative dehydrogenase [Phycisphaerales bacterium]